MDKQNIVRDLKVVSFEILYSQVKDILSKISSDNEVFGKLQTTIDSVDNLLSTIREDEQDDVVVKTVDSGKENANVEVEQNNSNEVENVAEDVGDNTSDINDKEVDSANTELNGENVKVEDEVYQAETVASDESFSEAHSSSEDNSIEADVNENINYNLEEYTRLTNNPVKAIIVNVNQLRKLRESLQQQRQSLDFGAVSVKDSDTNPTVSIEDLLEQASQLYREGKVLESEKLYEQIRNMNKSA